DAEVRPAHLLLALLDEEEGHVAQLLAGCGISPAQVRLALAAPDCGEVLDGATGLLWSHAAQVIFDRARQFGVDASADRTVTTGHLWLAVLHADETLRGMLERLGLDMGAVESQVLGEQQLALRLEEPLQLGIPAEETDLARILDVAANRSREALRVLE